MQDEDLTVEDMGIFQNQDEVVDSIIKASKAIGAPTSGMEKLKSGKPLEFLVARKSCKNCWGRGTLDFYPNSLEEKLKIQEAIKDKGTCATNLVKLKKKVLCKCVKIRME